MLWAGLVIALCVMGILILVSVAFLLTLPFFALIVFMLVRVGTLRGAPGLGLVFVRSVLRPLGKQLVFMLRNRRR